MTSNGATLVTGANGFVGRFVCSELARQGQGVRAAVRSIDRGSGLPGDVVAVGNIGPDTDWTEALTGVEAVIHLAARVHVMKESAADPLAAFRAVNVTATSALARAAAARGVRRFVYVSSIKVNGEGTGEVPYAPDDDPRPVDPYGVSKHEAERELGRLASETGLEVTVVRPPLVYGPGVGGNFLRLLSLVSKRIPLPLGAVENRRSMIYAGNLAHALVACARHVGGAGKTYLVSDGVDLSTPELVRRLAAALGTTPRLWPVPPGILRLGGALTGRKDEIDRLIHSLAVDSGGIRADLGWNPPVGVGEGLAETAGWFQRRHAG